MKNCRIDCQEFDTLAFQYIKDYLNNGLIDYQEFDSLASQYIKYYSNNNKFAVFEEFLKLCPSAYDYIQWCKEIKKEDADFKVFLSLNPLQSDYVEWCRDINIKDASTKIFLSLEPSGEFDTYYLDSHRFLEEVISKIVE